MSLFRDDAGKTERPTPGKLREAEGKGQVPISRELTMAVTLLIVVVVLTWSGGWLIDSLSGALRHGLDVDLRAHLLDDASIPAMISEILRMLQDLAAPVLFMFVLFVLATAIAGYSQIGFRFRHNALRLQPEKLNPVTNLGNLMRLSSVIRALVSLLKLAVLASVLYLVMTARMPVFVRMYEAEMSESMRLLADTVFLVLTWISVLVLVVAIGDMAWQRYDYLQNLKMTKQEVDDERKRNDGDPQVKHRLRAAALEIMRHRMMESIPDADVVIINPTHFSVALRYDRVKNAAPEVVAKGIDDVALKIRDIAREHRVPLMEDPPLARTLFRAVRVGQEVPEKFYRSVAAVLSHVLRLEGEVA